MKTLLLSLLCLFVWNQTTEAFTDQRLVLGQNVTLACEFRLKAIIWFVMKLPARPEMILRTFGPPKQVEYYNTKFISKYSEGGCSRLFINNVSADDLGIYYCIKPGWYLEVSNGTRLHTSESPQSHNEPEQKNPAQDQTALQILIIMFSLLTVVLFAAVIGLLMMNHKLSKNIPEYVNGHQISTMKFRESNRGKTDPEYLEVLPNIRGLLLVCQTTESLTDKQEYIIVQKQARLYSSAMAPDFTLLNLPMTKIKQNATIIIKHIVKQHPIFTGF
ncbi:uncharacterized protein LOC107704426 isoform X1 [Sinocyclocheilus anshuiensis]|uniref:uncharacterized protein LOC107704426 isoform X1 n=1 Tax=Sinocyclocheilus anshuiensis TaxID=1608454 RepID=UPI0007B8C900|nr:PREDICTED: uncharacterized protein LOC107704426 isoform X1 [Sinocyclocheilus anshuiensis]